MKFLWILWLGINVLDNPFHPVLVVQAKNTSTGVRTPARQLYLYRRIQWCITGLDEPELHGWPLNQFVPILRRSISHFRLNENFRYQLKFREIQTEQYDLGHKGGLLKSVHVIFKAEALRDVNLNILEQWNPLLLEGLIIQANYNPETIGMPVGQFFKVQDHGVNCQDCDAAYWVDTMPCRKRAVVHMEHPTVLIFHHLHNKLGTKSEIHANFRWYSPPCAEVRRLLFYVLAVRSFDLNQFDVVRMGPYQVTTRGQRFHSEIHPSPYFKFFSQKAVCHSETSSTDIQTDHPQKYSDFEMSSKFDCCTKNEANPKNPSVHTYNTQKPTFNCTAAAINPSESPLNLAFGKESWQCGFPKPIKCLYGTPPERADRPYVACVPCQFPVSTTILTTTTKKPPLIKRTVHGMLMIMTNFCLQPIVIYIARFYKETYNSIICKGMKSWYWMHMLGGMVSSTMVYFGYFSGGSDKENQAHVILGNTYILILAFCYMTAWGRNKNSIINIIMEFCHGCLGYTVISMAIVSIATSPNLGYASKLSIYLMVGFQGMFMIAMTCHICCWDSKFGMKPRRRHFPTIEARFDEVKVPGGKFRKIMLTIFAITTFSLSAGSTFME